MRARQPSSCCRSASITATIGDDVDRTPSTQADDSPLRPKRCRHLTRGSARAMSRTNDAVPSGELSSTKTISQDTFGSASATAAITPAMLSRSLNVGMMMDSSAARTARLRGSGQRKIGRSDCPSRSRPSRAIRITACAGAPCREGTSKTCAGTAIAMGRPGDRRVQRVAHGAMFPPASIAAAKENEHSHCPTGLQRWAARGARMTGGSARIGGSANELRRCGEIDDRACRDTASRGMSRSRARLSVPRMSCDPRVAVASRLTRPLSPLASRHGCNAIPCRERAAARAFGRGAARHADDGAIHRDQGGQSGLPAVLPDGRFLRAVLRGCRGRDAARSASCSPSAASISAATSRCAACRSSAPTNICTG